MKTNEEDDEEEEEEKEKGKNRRGCHRGRFEKEKEGRKKDLYEDGSIPASILKQ